MLAVHGREVGAMEGRRKPIHVLDRGAIGESEPTTICDIGTSLASASMVIEFDICAVS
jgi:hypothetical protein